MFTVVRSKFYIHGLEMAFESSDFNDMVITKKNRDGIHSWQDCTKRRTRKRLAFSFAF